MPNLLHETFLWFSERLEKKVVDIDEENDEISYLMKQTFAFNRHKSVNLSSHDKVTILNPAYVGAITAVSKNNYYTVGARNKNIKYKI